MLKLDEKCNNSKNNEKTKLLISKTFHQNFDKRNDREGRGNDER